MADRLTQLQDALDELATQFYSCIRYIHERHSPPLEPPRGAGGAGDGSGGGGGGNDGSAGPAAAAAATTTGEVGAGAGAGAGAEAGAEAGAGAAGGGGGGAQHPLSPSQLCLDQRELARDLLLREQQIELLISLLPGIGTSTHAQHSRLRALERQLRAAEARRAAAARDKERLLQLLDEVVMAVRRW